MAIVTGGDSSREAVSLSPAEGGKPTASHLPPQLSLSLTCSAAAAIIFLFLVVFIIKVQPIHTIQNIVRLRLCLRLCLALRDGSVSSRCLRLRLRSPRRRGGLADGLWKGNNNNQE